MKKEPNNYWSKHPAKHVPIVPALLIAFMLLFILGIMQEIGDVQDSMVNETVVLP